MKIIKDIIREFEVSSELKKTNKKSYFTKLKMIEEGYVSLEKLKSIVDGAKSYADMVNIPSQTKAYEHLLTIFEYYKNNPSELPYNKIKKSDRKDNYQIFASTDEFQNSILDIENYDLDILKKIKPTLKKEFNWEANTTSETTGKYDLDFQFEKEFNKSASINTLIEDKVTLNLDNKKIFIVSGFEKLFASMFDMELKKNLLLYKDEDPELDTFFKTRVEIWDEFFFRLNELYEIEIKSN